MTAAAPSVAGVAPPLDRERVLACAVRLLDLGFFRIGTEGYAEQHQHYGLATIRKKHVRVDGDVVTFDYVAKSGKRRIQSVVDPAVHDIVSQLKRRRGGGYELLAYKERGSSSISAAGASGPEDPISSKRRRVEEHRGTRWRGRRNCRRRSRARRSPVSS